MMDRARLVWRTAEVQCGEYLQRKGYRLITLNFRCRGGEIDIIAQDPIRRGPFGLIKYGGYIVFVEVKLRSSRVMGEAREAVNWRKQQRIKLAAKVYLAKHDITSLQPRFDVMEVYPGEKPGESEPEIHHFINAFE